MLKISTFIWDGRQLVPLSGFSGPVSDPLYVEGAIEITANGSVLFSKGMADLVDQLWAELINALEALAQYKAFASYFPDQAIRFEIAPIDSSRWKWLVECHGITSAIFDGNQAMKVLLAEGLAFFEIMAKLNPTQIRLYDNCISRIKTLMTKMDAGVRGAPL